MGSTKYLIALNSENKRFFTSSSAYDSPEWVELSEATEYHSVDSAMHAHKKLISKGSYSAKIVEKRNVVDQSAFKFDALLKDSGVKSYAPAHNSHRDDFLDAAKEDEEESGEKTVVVKVCTREETPDEETPKNDLKEEFTMPEKPKSDTTPVEDPNLIPELPSVPVIDYNDPYNLQTKDEDKLGYTISGEQQEKVNVPVEIIIMLKNSEKDFRDCANYNDDSNTDRGSFCATVAAALFDLRRDLEEGTVEGIKNAQIKLSSYMNPITSHIPPEVIKFISRGGRKSNLKDLFYGMKSSTY